MQNLQENTCSGLQISCLRRLLLAAERHGGTGLTKFHAIRSKIVKSNDFIKSIFIYLLFETWLLGMVSCFQEAYASRQLEFLLAPLPICIYRNITEIQYHNYYYYIWPSGRSRCAFSENGIVYYALFRRY